MQRYKNFNVATMATKSVYVVCGVACYLSLLLLLWSEDCLSELCRSGGD